MLLYTRIDHRIWGEPWFRELPDDSPLLWLWLNHNRYISPCGLWRIDLPRASAETLLPERDIARWLAAWERLGLLRSDGRFLLLPEYSVQQCVTPRLLEQAQRDAVALGPETPLAMEWLASQRGEAGDALWSSDDSRGRRAS
jgi:hypothetical protein